MSSADILLGLARRLLWHFIFVFQVLQTWCVEQFSRDSSLYSPSGHDNPEQDYRDRKYRSQHPEEQTGHLCSEGNGAYRVHTQWEGKSPPEGHVRNHRQTDLASNVRPKCGDASDKW